MSRQLSDARRIRMHDEIVVLSCYHYYYFNCLVIVIQPSVGRTEKTDTQLHFVHHVSSYELN